MLRKITNYLPEAGGKEGIEVGKSCKRTGGNVQIRFETLVRQFTGVLSE